MTHGADDTGPADVDASDWTRDFDHERPPSDAASDAESHPNGEAPSSDPRRIRSVAVTESDVIDALEATARGGREVVLRVTPPFSGRMRARLHDAGALSGEGGAEGTTTPADEGHTSDTAPVQIPPDRFVADPPAYPTVDDTEDELRRSETAYSRERHRERHQAAVAEWRRTVRERLVETVTLRTDAGPTTVSVAYLG